MSQCEKVNVSLDDSEFITHHLCKSPNEEQECLNEAVYQIPSFNSPLCESSLANYNSERRKDGASTTTKSADNVNLDMPFRLIYRELSNCSKEPAGTATSYKPQINSDKNIHNNVFTLSKHLMTSLSAWGLPQNILCQYESRGIINMFDWQAECLCNHKLLIENRNLIYSAPTSAGKTLVAEILAIKILLEKLKKVIVILPFVSVVREKTIYFQHILSSSGIRVEGFMGSHVPPGGFKNVQFAVCTIEKANGIINRLLEEGNLSDVGAVIVDEIHLLSDPSRGYILELLLTKLQYMSAKYDEVNIQLIGMSATLSNLEMLAKWLDAELYTTEYRPVPLYERCLVSGVMYDTNFKKQRTLNRLPELSDDSDYILQLCLETIDEGRSLLIFCPSKNWCESLGQQISVAFKKLGKSCPKFGPLLRKELSANDIKEVLEQLQRCPVGLDDVLRKTVSFGVAFHHAGLTMDERDIIEGAFRSGALRVIVATSTLSSGVNLPARRVIIRTPLFYGKPLDALTYRQMIGRAGRMGKDSFGESVLVCQEGYQHIGSELMSSKLEPITSCLETSAKFNRALLEIIASGVICTDKEAHNFGRKTLLAAHTTEMIILELVKSSVNFLKHNELVRVYRDDLGNLTLSATGLGKACLASSLPPEDGLILFEELEKARKCFVLDTELHLLYLVTPYSVCNMWTNINWMSYLDMWEKLPASMKRVGEMVGVRENYMYASVNGFVSKATKHALHVHRRFYTALALQDLVNEVPLNKVAQKFECSRGMLQSLQQSASMFAGMLTSFCNQLRWRSIELLVSQFQDRLQFGIQYELIELMKLPDMNGPRARALYDAGIQSLVDLASADISYLENILYGSVPFESEKVDDKQQQNLECTIQKNMRTIWISGKAGLTARQAAQILIKGARNYLQLEMGAVAVKWDNSGDGVCVIEKRDEVEQQSTHSIANAEIVPPSNYSSSSSIHSFERSLNLNSKSCVLEKPVGSDDELFNTSNSETDNNNSNIIDTSISEATNSSKFFKTITSAKKRMSNNFTNRINTENNFQVKKTKYPDFDNNENMSVLELVHEVYHYDFNLVPVVDNINDFEIFCQNIPNVRRLSFALAFDYLENMPHAIGQDIIKPFHKKDNCRPEMLQYGNKQVSGFSVSWDENTAYYVSLNCPERERILDMFRAVLSNPNVILIMLDCKEHIRTLHFACNVSVKCKIEDPQVAAWILEPDETEFLTRLMRRCEMKRDAHARMLEISSGKGSCTLSNQFISAAKAVTIWDINKSLKEISSFRDINFTEIFELEMGSMLVLARMEITGIGIDKRELQNKISLVQEYITSLENQTYLLTRRRINLNSAKAVATALNIYKRRHVSINKKTLERLSNPLSRVILQRRKLINTLVKILLPLAKHVQNNRLHFLCKTFSATGRISMHEPNVQNVPRNFTVHAGDNSSVELSVRSIFVPTAGKVLLSADYCQLELRILAHLSKDEALIRAFNSNTDIFKQIAADLNKSTLDEVNDIQRQHAKQLCYAIIYGMGTKALADELTTDEEEANNFMSTFRLMYPRVQHFINDTVISCGINGYVETLTGRRRRLPNILSKDVALAGKAERQAVNTRVQGTAADIAKRAMVQAEAAIDEYYRRRGYEHKPTNLVLQLHDELVYELPRRDIYLIAGILKREMENAITLMVPLPVKYKWGMTWGHMLPYTV